MRHGSRLGALVVLVLVGALGASASARSEAVEATVKDDGGKPVAEAVVLLTPVSAQPPSPAKPAVTVMDQQDKEFVPHVLPVYVGTAVSFPNLDNIRHHVYSFSPPKKFELPLYIGTPAAPVIFDKPGVVALGCNIHDWMVGYIYVLSTPYFAKTGADGVARIADVPPGAYEARVWHPRLKVALEKTSRPLTVSATEASPLTFVIGLKREWRAPRGPGRYDGARPAG
jgi:plastocyanin